MRISDWSSDVCSSDLAGGADRHQAAAAAALLQFLRGGGDDARAGGGEGVAGGQRGAVDVELRRVDAAERRIQAEPGLAVILALPRPQRAQHLGGEGFRSEEHTSELQSLMRISSAGFCLK